MGILDWLFGKKQQTAPKRSSIAIPTPDDYPPELLVPFPPFERPPHRKGKRYTHEEQEARQEHYNAQMLPRNIAKHQYDLRRLSRIKVTHFIWQDAGKDGGSCSHCRKMSGKKFSYAEMTIGKSPGTFICNSGHICRCICEPVLP